MTNNIELKEHNENWFVLKSTFYAMGLDYKDLAKVNRLTGDKLRQLKNRMKKK